MRALLSTFGYPPIAHGGIGLYTWHLAQALSAMGHTTHVVTCGRALSRQTTPGLFVHYVPMPVNSPFGTSILGDALTWGMALHQAAEEIGRRWGIDLIETPNSPPEGAVVEELGAWPVVVRISSPTPVWQVNDGWRLEGDRLTVCALEERLLQRAKGLMPVSQAVFDDAQRCFRLPDGVAHRVIHLGFPADYGEETPLPPMEEAVRVLVLSRFQPSKGARALLAAIPRVLGRNRKARFDIVARDVPPWTFRADFEREHPELLDRVTFHSRISDEEKKSLLRRCHMMVAPSRYESFGLMYVEAMAFGRAVIGCPVGGVPEIVADGQTGLLVKPDDEEALAEAILALAADPNRCAALGRAGRERFLSDFTAERMARETAAFYERVLSGGGAA
jgi:hypothetical protein